MTNPVSILPEIDQLGTPFGWRQGTGDWAGVDAEIARGESVQVIQEAGSTQWQSTLPAQHPFQFGFPEFTAEVREERPTPKARVWISPIQRRFADSTDLPKVQWHPRVLWIGIGCERGTPEIVIAHAIQQALRSHHLAEAAIAGLATIDHKADEAGLMNYCHDLSLPLKCFSAAELRAIAVPNPSTHVHSKAGTPSVAEAAAILATSGCLTSSAPSRPSPLASRLIVPKQIFRLTDRPGAVTIAIAQAEQEYTDQVLPMT
ncbi:MAG: cobalamin biosynthesis protein CbiG [Leptolyngbya sp.]|nr:MAG: cobalamin biosynthesis protein CbiG [Leptolyngbya sp.]